MDLNRVVLFWCFIFFLVMPEPAIVIAQPYLGAAYHTCMHNTTTGTTLSSTFKHNLNLALRNLTTLSSQGTKYVITTAGFGDDMVYAMFQCRGDLTMQWCSECMANATVRLPERDCSSSIGARIQLDGCYLRYDNRPFFTPDFNFTIGYCYARTSDVKALMAAETEMGAVVKLAPTQDGFASVTMNGMYYAVAQCLGYLTESECSQCLTKYSYRTICDSTLGEQLHLTSCYYRYEPYSFFGAAQPGYSILAAPPPPPPPGHLAASPPPAAVATTGKETHRVSKTLILASSGAAGAIVVVGGLGVVVLMRRNKANKRRGMKCVDKSAGWPRSLWETKAEVFLLQELDEATKHFHPNNKLGEGGYGPVYKGTLSNGVPVAIKKLAIGSQQGKREFLNEVNLITSVQHKNLIRLLGSCVEGHERILVYEYLPNKSLDSFIFESKDDKTLDWPARFGIVLGMAKGLAYLHEESHIRIIHRDIKPSNILLDDQLNPIIADFGLARLVQDDETQINTRLAGTIGYLAPEYAMHGEFSEKVDVFSFGLVCLEIISGKRNRSSRLLSWVWELYLQNKLLDLVDAKLGNGFSHEEVTCVIRVALLCTQENPKQRPTMSMATLWLFGKLEILQIPNKPAFIEFSEDRVPVNDNYQGNPKSSTSLRHGSQFFSNNIPNISGGAQSLSRMEPR